MQVTEIKYQNASPVESYGPGFFRIAGEVIHGPMLVTADSARSWGGLDDVEPLLALAGTVDVLFVGMGAEMLPLPAGLRARLEEAGVGVEQMASTTACRSYNVLLAEGRRIALAALPV